MNEVYKVDSESSTKSYLSKDSTTTPKKRKRKSSTEHDKEKNGVSNKDDQCQLYSRLLERAYREEWEMMDIGRLLRLIVIEQWNLNPKKTCKYIRRNCAELVNIEFLEGLNISFTSKQLLKIFKKGSGSENVFLEKVSNAIEAEYFVISQDENFLPSLWKTMKTTSKSLDEIILCINKLIGSVNTIRECGIIMKSVVQDYMIPQKQKLVQQIILTPTFQDLNGPRDMILNEFFPELKQHIEMPTDLGGSDVDENGNLKDFCVDDDEPVEYESGSGNEDEVIKIDCDEDEDEDGSSEEDDEKSVNKAIKELMTGERSPPTHYILDEAESVNSEDNSDLASSESEMDEAFRGGYKKKKVFESDNSSEDDTF